MLEISRSPLCGSNFAVPSELAHLDEWHVVHVRRRLLRLLAAARQARVQSLSAQLLLRRQPDDELHRELDHAFR